MQAIAVPESTCSPSADKQWTFPFPPCDWERTPDSVRLHVLALLRENRTLASSITELTAKLAQVEASLEKANAKLRQNSKNSSRPPSSDNPYRKNPSSTVGGGVVTAPSGDAVQPNPTARGEKPTATPSGEKGDPEPPASHPATDKARPHNTSRQASAAQSRTKRPTLTVVKTDEAPKKKPGAKPGHSGHSQKLLPPDHTVRIAPEPCSCGAECFSHLTVYNELQQFEFAEKPVMITRIELLKGCCDGCGKVSKAKLPPRYQTGYGPRLTAFVAEIVGMMGDSRTALQALLLSVFGVPVSLGAIQKMVDRTSQAILPYYNAIATLARSAKINHFDETLWYLTHRLSWLWVMANTSVALFMIHPHRSKKAFLDLVDTWKGILVADGYAVYRKWTELRQSCLAHLIRRAEALAQHANPEIAHFGRLAKAELQRLVHMATAPPTVGQWNAFYARFVGLLFGTVDRKDEAGTLARTLLSELDHLWLFLEVSGVAPTNNLAERLLRFAVLWRKRSLGTASEKGCRWVERILTLRQTARLRKRPTFPILVDALTCFFEGKTPDLSWLEETTNLPAAHPSEASRENPPLSTAA